MKDSGNCPGESYLVFFCIQINIKLRNHNICCSSSSGSEWWFTYWFEEFKTMMPLLTIIMSREIMFHLCRWMTYPSQAIGHLILTLHNKDLLHHSTLSSHPHSVPCLGLTQPGSSMAHPRLHYSIDVYPAANASWSTNSMSFMAHHPPVQIQSEAFLTNTTAASSANWYPTQGNLTKSPPMHSKFNHSHHLKAALTRLL
jgi:hypothetical protein